ncbi:class I SAM-dependent DNA methyltransferase [Paenibacillus wenxiniae]|uniref:Class I SAM-dependent DNA methyltransferase n=1 Tax=Paenibacillus wenxiniae TaxID=1636843 RepID=A0ABW4RQB5_9BACL
MGNTDKFEQMAFKYDSPTRIEVAVKAAAAIRHYVHDAGNKHAIDFGCGTGLVGMELLDDFRSVLFIDSSSNMIHAVDQKIKNIGVHNASTLCFDLEQDRLDELSADYIFMSQVLLHIADVEFILSRLYLMLNEGGHVIIVDFDHHNGVHSEFVHPGFVQTDLAAQMKEIGYTDVQSYTFYAGERLFMNLDATMFVLDARK